MRTEHEETRMNNNEPKNDALQWMVSGNTFQMCGRTVKRLPEMRNSTCRPQVQNFSACRNLCAVFQTSASSGLTSLRSQPAIMPAAKDRNNTME